MATRLLVLCTLSQLWLVLSQCLGMESIAEREGEGIGCDSLGRVKGVSELRGGILLAEFGM